MTQLAQRGNEEEVREYKDVLPELANAKFLYVHNPDSWEFSQERHEWLPRLKKFKLIPGCNGVRAGGDYAEAKAHFESREGWIFLPLTLAVCYTEDGLLVEGQGYRRWWDGIGGRVYDDVWSIPAQIGVGKHARVVWEFDQRGYDEWRSRLVRTGVIPAVIPAVQGAVIDLQSLRVERSAGQAHAGANPAIQAKHARNTERLEAMHRSLAPEVEPVARKGRGKADVD